MARTIVFTEHGELVERETPDEEQHIVRIGYTTSWTELAVFAIIIVAILAAVT